MLQMQSIASSLCASTEVKAISLCGHRFAVSIQEQNGATLSYFQTIFLGPLQTQQEMPFHDGKEYGLLEPKSPHPPVCPEAK